MNEKLPKRTVNTVINRITGKIIEADNFFAPHKPHGDPFKIRYQIEEHLQNDTPIIICFFCKQPIKISGGGKKRKTLYFKHLNGSDDCQQKSDNNYTQEEIKRMKYNGAKESPKHFRLKNLIADYLKLTPNAKDVEIEKVFKDKAIPRKWKKPDVRADFNNIPVVFELQISTTFLSVIVARNVFYKRMQTFIIWIFDSFSIHSDLQKFTQKDIFHNNSFNVFVFDDEAIEKSKEENKFILKCYYKKQFIFGYEIKEKWEKILVSMDDLFFDSKTYQVIFHDSDEEKFFLEKQIDGFKALVKQKKENDRKKEILKRKEKEVESVLITLRDLYKRGVFAGEHIYRQVNRLDIDSQRLLNEKLDLNRIEDKETKCPLINSYIKSGKKDFFASFIIKCQNVYINIQGIDKDGITLLQEIYRREKFPLREEFIQDVFKSGYNLPKSDNDFLKKEYSKKDIKVKQRVLRTRFYSKVSSTVFISQVYAIDTILFTILSAKRKKVIGFRFSNLLGLANHAIQHYPSYWEFIDRAFEVFGTKEEIRKLDKKGTFENKEKMFKWGNHKLKKEFIPVISDLFCKTMESYF